MFYLVTLPSNLNGGGCLSQSFKNNYNPSSFFSGHTNWMFLDIPHAIHVATLVLSGCNCSWLPMIIIHCSYILTNFPLSQLSHNLFSAIDAYAYLYGSSWWTSFIILPRHHRQYPHPQVHCSFRSCLLFFGSDIFLPLLVGQVSLLEVS